jgi:nitroimidazol reductase NimA-like FMN-containing flavoprotein (pyridoxamine 5'-phosphate oxidase superfamily)
MKDNDEPLFDFDKPSTSSPNLGGAELEARIRGLVGGQPYAVLCTQSQTQPYGALVAFAFSEDLEQAVFATSVATRKFRILSECRQVALVIDSRPSHPNDFMKVEAVTATGRATFLEQPTEVDRWAQLLLARHPYLESFVAAPSCALFRIEIVRYLHVARFQEVRQWTP